ncbi:MAG: Tab2 family RNA-binding protein [Synechococcales bacterium]|nr:Tab2 family RNA-binding protein [Synechococcales bacterium]
MTNPLLNPPNPMPENLWGDRWRFASLPAGDLWDSFCDRMIPITQLPDSLNPLTLGLPSNVAIPGVVIDGGRRSMQLARWLESVQPQAAHFVPGPPDGLILRAGERDRYILTTFEDPEVHQAGEIFNQRRQGALGLHFLLVQPDESGMTYSGIWLLQG